MFLIPTQFMKINEVTHSGSVGFKFIFDFNFWPQQQYVQKCIFKVVVFEYTLCDVYECKHKHCTHLIKTSLLTLGLQNSISTIWAEKPQFCTSGLYRGCIPCESTYRGKTVTHILGYISGIHLSNSGHFLIRYLQSTGPWAQHLICPGKREACCSFLAE